MRQTRFLISELAELSIRGWRYVAYLATAMAAVVLTASLAVAPLPVKISMFHGGLRAAGYDIARVEDAIVQFGDLEIVRHEGYLDPEIVRAEMAGLAIGLRDGKFAVLMNEATPGPTAAPLIAGPLASMLSRFPRPTADDQSLLLSDAVEEMVVDTASGTATTPERLGLMPRSNRLVFVPRVIALFSIFAAFLVAFESYARQLGARHLQIQLAGSRGGFDAFIRAKLLVATAAGTCTFALLLILINALYGVPPRGDLVGVLVVYVLACFASGALGLAAATIIGPSRQLFATLAAYFFGLIAFSGFIVPLAGAEPWVQGGSYFLPLRFPLAVTDAWIAYGHGPGFPENVRSLALWATTGETPQHGALELLYFVALLIGSGLLLMLATRWTRSRF
jgi:hypothetical protein